MTPLVSILIPAYNAEKWIAQTISSAINQSWGNREIIVVDDGSSDHTFDRAKKYESPFVKVIKQENAGACAARNNALSLAQGDYIQWLDADDLLHPEKISQQLAAAGDSSDSRILLTGAWGKFYHRPEKAKFSPDKLWRSLAPADWITTKFSNNVWMNPAVWLVSRQLTELAGPWNERLSLSGDDDGEYICRVAAKSNGVQFVSKAQSYYRQGNIGSLNWSMGKSESSLRSLVLSLDLSIKHLIALEDSERTRSASLQHLANMFPYFYGADPGLQNQVKVLANRLGGYLNGPTVSWKYRPIEKLLGPPTTMKIMNSWRSGKLLAYGHLDKFLFERSRKARKFVD